LSKFSSRRQIVCNNCLEIEKYNRKLKLKELVQKKCRNCNSDILVKRKNCILICEKCKQSVLHKQVQEDRRKKREQTNLKKYGIKNLFEDSKMLKQVFFKKYGVTNCMHVESVKKKIEQTNLERYQSKNVFGSEKIKQKIKTINLKKYGVEHPMQSEEVLKKALKHDKKCFFTKPHQKLKQQINQNFPENNFLTEQFIKINKRAYSIDELDRVKKIVIFVDGDYWHANPSKYDKNHKIGSTLAQEIWKYDEQVKNELTNKDYVVIRFWQSTIDKNMNYCMLAIENVLKNYKTIQNIRKISRSIKSEHEEQNKFDLQEKLKNDVELRQIMYEYKAKYYPEEKIYGY
jgi:very-short-patch-repair endonuclease/ribosomal protein L37AE/L43A